MAYSIPVDTWVPGSTWRPNSFDGFSTHICWKFVFYHIRPTDRVVMVADSGAGFKNGIEIIDPKQVSLIVGVCSGFFKCVTMVGSFLNKEKQYLAADYDSAINTGNAKFWYLPINQLHSGGWEVFNGPNKIDIEIR